MKFKDFQAPVLFSSTFKALNLGGKNSSTFKDAWEVGTLPPTLCRRGSNKGHTNIEGFTVYNHCFTSNTSLSIPFLFDTLKQTKTTAQRSRTVTKSGGQSRNS